MKLVTYVAGDGAARPGVVDGETLYDLSPLKFSSTVAFLEAGESALETAKALVAAGGGVKAAGVKLLAPIQRPPRLFGIGLNYAEHAAESKFDTQEVPTVFIKASSAVIGPGETVILPKNATKPDYEVELAVVIGKPGYRITPEKCWEHVFGYTIVNDISARDVQRATTQWSLGKSFPTFAPMGPWIVTKDEIADPHKLDISLEIDGETLQHSNTEMLIFKIPALIEYISSITPLEAGDVISTGTPEGVGMGREPQRWLKPGETMTLRVEGIGELVNPIKAEEV